MTLHTGLGSFARRIKSAAIKKLSKKKQSPILFNIDGIRIDDVNGNHLMGWCAVKGSPSERAKIEIYHRDELLFSGLCDAWRDDIAHAGISNGHSGWSWRLPEEHLFDTPLKLVFSWANENLEVDYLINQDSKNAAATSELLESNLDGFYDTTIAGWAFSPAYPDAKVEVIFKKSDKIIGSTIANQFRSDLVVPEKRDGYQGFNWSVLGNISTDTENQLSIEYQINGKTLGSDTIIIPSLEITTKPKTIRSNIDRFESNLLVGWIVDTANPSSILDICVINNKNEVIAEARADRYRPDLETSEIGDGYNGFQLRLPYEELSNGATFKVMLKGSNYLLTNGAIEFFDEEKLSPIASMEQNLINLEGRIADLEFRLAEAMTRAPAASISDNEKSKFTSANIDESIVQNGRMLQTIVANMNSTRLSDEDLEETDGALSLGWGWPTPLQTRIYRAFSNNCINDALTLKKAQDYFREILSSEGIIALAHFGKRSYESLKNEGFSKKSLNLFADALLKTLARFSRETAVRVGISWLAEVQPSGKGWEFLAYTLLREGRISEAKKFLEKMPPGASRNEIETVISRQLHRLENGLDLPAKAKAKPKPEIEHILYVAHHCYPFHTNGYAVRTHELVKSFHKLGHHVTVLARPGYPFDLNGFADAEYSPKRIIDDVPHIFFPAESPSFKDTDLQDYLNNASIEIAKIADEIGATVIHAASNHSSALPALAAARLNGLPFIYEIRGLWDITRLSRDPDYAQTDGFKASMKLEAQCATEADMVICLTKGLADEAIKWGVDANKIRVLSNAADPEQFKPKQPDRSLIEEYGLEGKIVVGFAGSMVDYEGLDILVRALRIVKDTSDIPIKALFVGSGKEADNLKALVENNNLAQDIIFTGRVPFEKVADFYTVMDICPLPRKSLLVCEIVSPLKPFEAMAMQKTVLVSSVAALTEIVKDGKTGMVFEKDNSLDLAQKIITLASDEALRDKLAKNARKWIEDEKSWSKIGEICAGYYSQLRQILD